jgi:hypothetical protein
MGSDTMDIDSISDVIELISDFFSYTGYYCSDIINGALNIFSNLVNMGTKMLSYKIDNSAFSEFWEVINIITRVVGVVSSSLIIFFFLYNLFCDIESRSGELTVWGFAGKCLKLAMAIVIVNNAVNIIKAIFNSTSLLAKGIYVLIKGKNARWTLDNLALDSFASQRLQVGVSGIKGLFIFIIYLLGALVIVVNGVMIMIEIYQRIFKLYILIPFASLSFSTYASGDNKGHEVFNGYLKNIVATGLESIIMMAIIIFSFVLISSGTTMDKLFPSTIEDGTETVTIRNESELLVLYYSYKNGVNLPVDDDTFNSYVTWSDLSNEVLAVIQYDKNKNCTNTSALVTITNFSEKDIEGNPTSQVKLASVGGLRNYRNSLMTIDGVSVTGTNFYDFCFKSSTIAQKLSALATNTVSTTNDSTTTTSNVKSHTYPMTLTCYGELSFTSILIILLRVVFPCVLCTAGVKAAPQYAGMIMGR